MNLLKFEHAVQVTRWLGINYNKWDADQWKGLSKTFQVAVYKESELNLEMKDYELLKTHYKIITVLSRKPN